MLRHEADPGEDAARAFRPFPPQAQDQPSRPDGLAPLLRRRRAQADPARLRFADRRARRPSSRDHPCRRRIGGGPGPGGRPPAALSVAPAGASLSLTFSAAPARNARSRRQPPSPPPGSRCRLAPAWRAGAKARRRAGQPRVRSGAGCAARGGGEARPAGRTGPEPVPGPSQGFARRQACPPSSRAPDPLPRAPGRCATRPAGSIHPASPSWRLIRARSNLSSVLLGSATASIPAPATISASSARRQPSSGRSTRALAPRTPPSPATPAPRLRRISRVSAWSSA